jgi:transcriptional regulator with XRE-family HTH domain
VAEVMVGDRVREMRNLHVPRMTQEVLAERSGVSVSMIAKVERGARSARLPTLGRIAKALDVRLSELVDPPATDNPCPACGGPIRPPEQDRPSRGRPVG